MSWFDTSGFANLAKSALKEAQKTIDKALDIKDDEAKLSQQSARDEQQNFFSTWGIKSTSGESEDAPKEQEAGGTWGSFTGSFFENPKTDDRFVKRIAERSESLAETSEIGARSVDEKIEERRVVPSTSLPEGIAKSGVSETRRNDENSILGAEVAARDKIGASQDSLRKQRSDDGGRKIDFNDEKRRYSASEIEGNEEKRKSEQSGVEFDGGNAIAEDEPRIVVGRRIKNEERRDPGAIRALNRVSIVSSESDKKSSESVEILGSRSGTNTDCTTTPESEDASTSASIVTSQTPVDAKRNSESVELLPDSTVTSPCSVDVLGDSNTDSSPFLSPIEDRAQLFTTSESEVEKLGDSSSDVSPYTSPSEQESKSEIVGKFVENEKTSISQGNLSFIKSEIDKISPESVEVITDVDEIEEVSQAEDSYTSASESTIMTIMEATYQQVEQSNKARLEFADKRMHDSCPDSGRGSGEAASSSVPPILSGVNLNSSLDSSKEKHNLHLPLEPITTQPIRKGEYRVEIISRIGDNDSTSDQIKDSTIEPPDDEAPLAEQDKGRIKQQSDLPDYPEQYLMLTDSSCEGTLIESSSEDNVIVLKGNESKGNTAGETPALTSSSYVKNMLADAMVEKGEIQLDPPARENSPISSESRSDLVKIGSDQTSGHTSGDELETTTSSDIEIISRYSPNGDSSSTQSRQSPANLHSTKSSDLLTRTLKPRGHSRELSEISVGSDDANFEIEKLLKRIQEMTEILQVRESKLIDVSRMNMELHEQNIHMKKQLDTIEMRAEQSLELNRITEDYTQRLSALEKKFQQSIGERDNLREQVEQLKHEAAGRLSSREIMTISAEKDEIIKELRVEGEKLSKQQLQHSNIIKKLRTKDKDNETLLKSQKEQLEEQSSELERLKRSLYAKEEVERSQIEAVHTLTARIKNQETEILTLQEKLDNALNKMEAYKTSLDAAKTDSSDTKMRLSVAEDELKRALENAGESCQLSAQVQDLRVKLRKSEEAHVRSVETLKRENNELLKRFEAAEARSEELSESVTLATKPLLRQLEQLQASFALKTNNFVKQEKLMAESIDELQTKLESLVATDRSLVEENLSLRAKVSTLESQIKRKDSGKSHVEESLEKLRSEYEKLGEDNSRYRKTIETLEQSHAEQVKELKREIQSLTDKLSVERAATDAEKRKNNAILEQQQSIDQESRLSPTLSIGRDSIGSTSSVWPAFNESLFESGSGRFPSVYDSLRAGGNSTSMIENLQAQVKQRDGEIQQLQWEMSRRNNERDALNMELSSLTLKIEELSSKVTEVEALNESLNEIQTRYDALLQMYGEKVEETQELRLDLEDVKEMYKSQIDQLLKRDT